MIRPALSSTALIGADVHTVLDVAAAAGCSSVEWTDDGFLEPGDSAAAGNLMFATLKAGLCTASYATLFRAGLHGRSAFDKALSTARELNAPIVRLWAAPRRSSPETDADALVSIARSLGDAAGSRGVTLCFGLSADSILDTAANAAAILSRIDHPFIKLAWSPVPGAGFDATMDSLTALSGRRGMAVIRSADLAGPASAAGKDGDRMEAWLQYLDVLDEQGGNPDMSRYVVIRSLASCGDGDLASSVRDIDAWSVSLRQHHKRRIL